MQAYHVYQVEVNANHLKRSLAKCIFLCAVKISWLVLVIHDFPEALNSSLALFLTAFVMCVFPLLKFSFLVKSAGRRLCFYLGLIYFLILTGICAEIVFMDITG